ncbi:hypothetical protein, partial [Mycoplasma todarodis]
KANGDSIDKILDAIKNATGVDLASGHKGTKITDVDLKADPKTGDIAVSVKTTTKGAVPADGTVTGTMKGHNDTVVSNSKARDSHAGDIQKKIDGVDIKTAQGKKTPKEVVDTIKKAIKAATKPDGTVDVKAVIDAVKKATGVDLGTGNFGTNPVTKVTGVDVSVGKPDGTINISVKTHTKGASPEDKTVTGTLKGNPTNVVNANKAQPTNTAAISASFKNATLIKQGTRTIAEVIKDILKGKNPAGILANIKTETGVDVAVTSNGTTITKVSLAVNAAGDGIDVTIETNTPNATTPAQPVKVVVKGETDAQIATKIASNLRDANIAKIKAEIKKHLDIKTKQGSKTIKEIIDEINAGKGAGVDTVIANLKRILGIR